MSKSLFPIRRLGAVLLLALSGGLAGPAAGQPPQRPVGLVEGTGPFYGHHPEAMVLADEIASKHELDRRWVRRAIARARQVPQVTQLVLPQPPSAPMNWQQYRGRFLDAERILAGAAFWREHRAALERASATYGVPAEIIIGVIGVETYYGRRLGRYRVMDALTTLALDFPSAHPRAAARQAFFRAELGEFLSLRRKAGIDPLKLRGSYAGALGIPQFMPSSWIRYAIDFDGDGRIDLLDSPVDAIGSVANYLKTFHWQPGLPTHYAVEFDPERLDMEALRAPDIRPTFPVLMFEAKGALVEPRGQQHAGKLALIELRNGTDEPSYVAGTENFYAITRYNWSSYYAMAVIELGQAVTRAVGPQGTQVSTTASNAGCSASTQKSTSLSPICK